MSLPRYETTEEQAAYSEGYNDGFKASSKLSDRGWENVVDLLARARDLLDEHRHWLGYPECRADGDKLFADLKEFFSDGDEEKGEAADSDSER